MAFDYVCKSVILFFVVTHLFLMCTWPGLQAGEFLLLQLA